MNAILNTFILGALVISGCDAAMRAVAFPGNTNYFIANNIGGRIQFDQADPTADVVVSGTVTGLAPGSSHGFHVHAFGDSRLIPSSQSSFGTHFNPLTVAHDYPPASIRHAGDMGNITADANGVAVVDRVIGQGKMTLAAGSDLSIIGRAVIIHSNPDQGSSQQPTGNAGVPLAFGKIGIANMNGNEAGPAPGTANNNLIANHIGVGSYFDGGSIWISLVGNQVTLYTNFSRALPLGGYQLRFFEFGDLVNTSRNYGNALDEGVIQFANSAETCHNLTVNVADMSSLVGRMSVLFSASGTAFSNIVSMGVIGFGNTGASFPFLNPTHTYVCTSGAARTVAWLAFVLAALALALVMA